MAKIITNAPVGYDGFGTITTQFTGLSESNNPDHEFREVAILPEHEMWQMSRYGSGLYVALTEGEWENEKEFRVLVETESGPQSLADRVEGWMIEDFQNEPAEQQTEIGVMMLAYSGERDGFKYASAFPKIQITHTMAEELPRLDAIYEKAKEAMENCEQAKL